VIPAVGTGGNLAYLAAENVVVLSASRIGLSTIVVRRWVWKEAVTVLRRKLGHRKGGGWGLVSSGGGVCGCSFRGRLGWLGGRELLFGLSFLTGVAALFRTFWLHI
jgi:hypothetical protein